MRPGDVTQPGVYEGRDGKQRRMLRIRPESSVIAGSHSSRGWVEWMAVKGKIRGRGSNAGPFNMTWAAFARWAVRVVAGEGGEA